MKFILKSIIAILVITLLIIISIVGIPIVDTDSYIMLLLMILAYMSLSILVMYVYFSISRIKDIFDQVEKGVDVTKDISKIVSSENFSDKRISIKRVIKLLLKLK